MSDRSTDFRDLCDALCEGVLDASGTAELERLVVSDASARRYYIQRTHLHTALYRAVDPASASAPSLTTDAPRSVLRRGFVVAAALAAVVAIAVTWWAVSADTTDAPEPDTDIVATVVDISAVVTDAGGDIVAAGDNFERGEYTVGDGVVELMTRSGVTATFRGPGRFAFVGPDGIVLTHGLVVLDVPTGSPSVTVRVRDFVFRDIGTRFAVSTDGADADVHVYDGAVEMRRGGRALRTLHAGEAGRATTAGVVDIDAVPVDTLLAGRWTIDQELDNAGFESHTPGKPHGIAGWEVFGVAVPEHPNVLRGSKPIVPVHEGEGVAKVFGRFDPEHVYSGLYQELPVVPGERCVGSVYAAHKSGDALVGANAAWCKFDFYDGDGMLIASVDSRERLTADSPVDTYEKLTVEAIVPPGAAAVRFVLIFQQDTDRSPGAALFDDASLRITRPLQSPLTENP